MRLTVMLACLAISWHAAGQELLLEERLRAHIEFLADDLLRGRQPGTEGYDVAARYVVSQFRQLGLEPAGVDGGYLQPVPLRRAWQEQDTARLSVRRGWAEHKLVFVDDFFMRPSKTDAETNLAAGMVFVGYGIHSPALDHDDYGPVDVRGKVAVFIGGQPHDFPSEEGAHFTSGREKMRAALAHGAVGTISIYTPRNEKRFAWDRVRNLVGQPSMGWLTPAGEVFAAPAQIRAEATVHFDAGAVFFEGAPYSLDEILAWDEQGAPIPAFELGGQVKMAQRSRHDTITSPNIAGVLPGSDPLLAGEYVVYTAHLDHIGELHGEGHEDAINNGAMDNASGVAVMLETARQFVSGQRPRRSLLFLAVTAEEKGLVGSEYFAHYPTVPIEAMAGVINLDMPLLLYDFGDVIAFGAGHSDIGAAVDQATAEMGIVQTPDPFPEQNVFVRSDHYRFVQQGVPSIFLVTGVTSRDSGEDLQATLSSFLSEHYHKPSDDLGLPINYAVGARFTHVNTRIGEILANRTERPRWHEGDFFGETFGR